jgi:hypothetical protein
MKEKVEKSAQRPSHSKDTSQRFAQEALHVCRMTISRTFGSFVNQ